MAHEITVRKNKKVEMAFVGEKPWHGLGQELQVGADIETWKEAAGMDWTIKRDVVRFRVEDDIDIIGGEHTMKDSSVLYRSDDLTPLAIVSNRYKLVQPEQVLEFFRDLTESNGFQLETAGTLFGGKRFWGLAKIGEDACIVGDDKIGGYILLSTSCDGTLATSARFTSVRVVCNNTLTMATKNRKSDVLIRHSSHFDADKIKNQLGIARDAFGDFLKSTRKLAKTKVSDPDATEFISKLLLDTKTIYKDDLTKSRQYQKIMDIFNGGSGMGSNMPGVKGTAWGLVNAVTEFVDHHVKTTTASHRMSSAWFGRGEELKNQALIRAEAI